MRKWIDTCFYVEDCLFFSLVQHWIASGNNDKHPSSILKRKNLKMSAGEPKLAAIGSLWHVL